MKEKLTSTEPSMPRYPALDGWHQYSMPELDYRLQLLLSSINLQLAISNAHCKSLALADPIEPNL